MQKISRNVSSAYITHRKKLFYLDVCILSTLFFLSSILISCPLYFLTHLCIHGGQCSIYSFSFSFTFSQLACHTRPTVGPKETEEGCWTWGKSLEEFWVACTVHSRCLWYVFKRKWWWYNGCRQSVRSVSSVEYYLKKSSPTLYLFLSLRSIPNSIDFHPLSRSEWSLRGKCTGITNNVNMI